MNLLEKLIEMSNAKVDKSNITGLLNSVRAQQLKVEYIARQNKIVKLESQLKTQKQEFETFKKQTIAELES